MTVLISKRELSSLAGSWIGVRMHMRMTDQSQLFHLEASRGVSRRNRFSPTWHTLWTSSLRLETATLQTAPSRPVCLLFVVIVRSRPRPLSTRWSRSRFEQLATAQVRKEEKMAKRVKKEEENRLFFLAAPNCSQEFRRHYETPSLVSEKLPRQVPQERNMLQGCLQEKESLQVCSHLHWLWRVQAP